MRNLNGVVDANFQTMNRIVSLIVSVLASSAVNREFDPDRFKPNTIKLVFVASPLSTQD
jgi:hypothetical protein